MTIITGKKLNDRNKTKPCDVKYYVIAFDNDDFFKEGLNKYFRPFYEGLSDGIICLQSGELHNFIVPPDSRTHGKYSCGHGDMYPLRLIWDVEIPDNAKVEVDNRVQSYTRTNQVILSNKRPLWDQDWVYDSLACWGTNWLWHVPKEKLTEELCVRLVKKNMNFVHELPEELVTKEMCNIALEHSIGATVVQKLPEKFVRNNDKSYTQWFLDKCDKMAIDTFNLEYIPDDVKTVEMINRIMDGDTMECIYDLIKCIPEHFTKDHDGNYTKWFVDICYKLLAEDGHCYGDIPKDLREQCLDMIQTMVDNKTITLSCVEHIPKELLTDEICLLAFEENSIACKRKWFPEHLKTVERKEKCDKEGWDLDLWERPGTQRENMNNYDDGIVTLGGMMFYTK